MDLNDLTDGQLEELLGLLATFAAWREVRAVRPDDAPFDQYANAVMGADDFRDDALEFVAVAQAVQEASRKLRLYVVDGE